MHLLMHELNCFTVAPRVEHNGGDRFWFHSHFSYNIFFFKLPQSKRADFRIIACEGEYDFILQLVQQLGGLDTHLAI